ncbi:MAG: primosomal protein N' [Defluviitaleaceae bacterium]|nr:primosomal protein N' [Defluviitaleaceae bacterium]
MVVVEVVVDIKNKAVDRVFDYEVPDALTELAVPGVRVMAPFGSRHLAGFILRVKASSDFEGKLQSITKVVDVVPVLNTELLELGQQLAKETGATMIACFDAMIPAAMKIKYRKTFVLVQGLDQTSELVDLFGTVKKVAEKDVPKPLLSALKAAIQKGQVDVVYESHESHGKKMRRYVKLKHQVTELAVAGKSKKQREVIEVLLAGDNPVAKDQLQASSAVLKALYDKEVIEYIDVEVYRDPYEDAVIQPDKEKELNASQQLAVQQINQAGDAVVLLHGVTGSGKTEVYLEAIAHAIAKRKQALVLIPEITLTTQITSRFKARFGLAVAVLHSGLSVGEKYDEWRKVLRGEVDVVIGTRSAVFAPLTHIGLIIVDEEHEATYKQEEMPRYHAIEVAKRRGKTHGCPVVLGSATPSLESYARAQKGVYQLAVLPDRAVTAASQPEIKLIDLNRQRLSDSSGVISLALEEAIESRLLKGQQSILLLNRRGYAHFMQCRDCHDVISCTNCDVTLTYHKPINGLKCHYCNFTIPIVHICPKCNSNEVRFFGTGTQKIEEFLATRYPTANVLRMDMDSTSKKGDHQRIIKAFENKEADILIGTQMVAKGLDFPGVTLVGVLDADMMLHFPDFKAAERTFQILTQVAGRAGRHQSGAHVYIETYSTHHYVMKHVKNQDYAAFYRDEMTLRRRFKYSPYFFHAKVLLSSTEPESLLIVSEQVNVYLRQALEKECVIIGPTMATVARVNKRFRMHFILKYKHAPHLTTVMTHLLAHVEHKDVSLAVDYFPIYLT